MTYGRLEDSFRRNPKVARLARSLGVRRAEARGLLTGLWSELLTQAPDGDLRSFDDLEIEEMADWEGAPGELIQALQDDRHRFLDRLRGRLIVHDWADYAEGLKRASWKRAERQRKREVSRDRGATVADEMRGDEMIRDDQRGDERDARARATPLATPSPPPPTPGTAELLEHVIELWDRLAPEVSLPRVARPVSSRFLKSFQARIAADASRSEAVWWEALVRRACAAAFLVRKKQPQTTIEWLLSKEEHVARLLAGDFDRDYAADDAAARSKPRTSSVRRNPGPTLPPVSARAAKAVTATSGQPSEEPALLKRLKALAGATSPVTGEGG